MRQENRPPNPGGRTRQKREVRIPEEFSVEQETGCEPAAARLEGRYVTFHRSRAAEPDRFGTSRMVQLCDTDMADAGVGHVPSMHL